LTILISKEEQEYDAIKEDLLGWDLIGRKNCILLIIFSSYMIGLLAWLKWKAYVDSQSSEDMAGKRNSNPSRYYVPTELYCCRNITLFEGMKTAIFQKEVMFLRAKLIWSQLICWCVIHWCTVLYIIITGPKSVEYPMYDYAHRRAIMEQISHSDLYLEFVMHRELYNWF
jgi:glutaminyl-tRNA synthetase